MSSLICIELGGIMEHLFADVFFFRVGRGCFAIKYLILFCEMRFLCLGAFCFLGASSRVACDSSVRCVFQVTQTGIK